MLGVLLFACLPLFSQQAVTEEARSRAMDAIEAKYDSLRALPSPERNRQTAAFMKTLKEIAEAGVSKDGNVWALFKDRVPYEIFANMTPLPPQSGPVRPPKPPARPTIVPLGIQETVRPAPIRPAAALAYLHEEDGPAAVTFPSAGPWAPLSSRAGGVQAQLQGNDLPVSTQAQVANALGNAFLDGTGKIRSMLEAKEGYKCAPGNDASVETLMTIRDRKPGVFFLQAHGGSGQIHDPVTDTNIDSYIFVTSSISTPELTRKYIDQNLFVDGYLGRAYAEADRDPNDPSIVNHKRFYTITSLFIRKFWRFSDNSFVFIHACTSIAMKETMRAAGASIYGGYDNLSNDYGLDSVLFLFDRMLGANLDEVEPHEEIAPQRPFDYQDIAVDMERKGLNPIAKDPGCKILFGLGPGNFGLLNPSIKFARIIPYQSRVELIGLFGVDPGEKNRKVEIENIAVPVESWEPERIVCHLPDSENGSCGEIKSHPSRPRQQFPLADPMDGHGELSRVRREGSPFQGRFYLRFVSDPWPYREHAGDKPIPHPAWGVSSMAGSKCSWVASGRVVDYDGKVLVKWSGEGTPPVVTDDLLIPLGGTFEVGGGVTDLLGRELWVSFGIVDNFTESPVARGDPREGKRPTKLRAYNDGQSAVKIHVSEDFEFLPGHCSASDESDESGEGATWSGMKATHTMPKSARR